jgi:hypothetical protein
VSELADRAGFAGAAMIRAQAEADRAAYLAQVAEFAALEAGDEAAARIWAERRVRLAAIARDIGAERDHYAWQDRR